MLLQTCRRCFVPEQLFFGIASPHLLHPVYTSPPLTPPQSTPHHTAPASCACFQLDHAATIPHHLTLPHCASLHKQDTDAALLTASACQTECRILRMHTRDCHTAVDGRVQLGHTKKNWCAVARPVRLMCCGLQVGSPPSNINWTPPGAAQHKGSPFAEGKHDISRVGHLHKAHPAVLSNLTLSPSPLPTLHQLPCQHGLVALSLTRFCRVRCQHMGTSTSQVQLWDYLCAQARLYHKNLDRLLR